MSLSFGHSPLLLIVSVLISGLITYFTYIRSRPLLKLSRRIPLVVLRFLSLSIIIFLLFEPVIRYFSSESHSPTIAVLIDSSQSGSIATAAYRDPFSTLSRLGLDDLGANIRYYEFDGSTRALGDGLSDSLSYSGVRTDINQALQYAREDIGDENLGGVLLLSDGVYNSGRNPLYLSERFPAPVHTILTGDSTRYADVQIRRALSNEIAYVNAGLPVQIAVRAEGFAGRTATITLSEGGQTRATTSVQLGENQREVVTELAYVPTTPGLKRLTVSVSRFEGELSYANNVSTVTVQVLENKIRTLLLAGAPSPDVSAIRNTLSTDPNLELTVLVQKEAGSYYEGALPATFSDFDVLVMAGYPGPATTSTEMIRIATAIEAGLPVFVLLGRQTNLGMLRDRLGAQLPATPQVIRMGFVEAQMSYASSLVHPVLEIDDVDAAEIRNLPPLSLNESRWRPAPDARTLANVRVQGVVLDDPLLLVRSNGAKRSAMLLGADYWRWQSLPEDLEALKPFWPRLLSNTLRWITTRKDDRPVRIRPTRTLYGNGEPVQFVGQVYDESLNPVDRASVSVIVTAPDGNRFPYTLGAQGSGRYFIDAGNFPEGVYTFSGAASVDENEIGTDTGSFAVGTVSVEFQETRADVDLLRQVAGRSGGIFAFASEAESFAEQLRSSGSLDPVVSLQQKENELWNLYPFLIAVILLLTLEWFFRKRFGMV